MSRYERLSGPGPNYFGWSYSSGITTFTAAGGQQIVSYSNSSGLLSIEGNASVGCKPFASGGYAWYASGLTNPSLTLFNGGTAITGSGAGVLGIGNATTNPTGGPTGGGILYEDSTNLALTHWGPGAAIYQIAPSGSGTQNTQLGKWLRQQAFLRTSSTTATTIYTSPSITASHVMTIIVTITSIDTTTLTSSAAAQVAASFVNSAGTVTQLGSTTTVFNHNYTTAPSFSISGTTVLVQVTAKTTDNTDHQADIQINYD